MSVAFKQVIKNIGNLTSNEKALSAHYLISSLEVKHDDSVDQAWVFKPATRQFLLLL
jgi:hypothetical protein